MKMLEKTTSLWMAHVNRVEGKLAVSVGYMRGLGYGTTEEGTGSQVGQATQETLSKMARKSPVVLDRFGSID